MGHKRLYRHCHQDEVRDAALTLTNLPDGKVVTPRTMTQPPVTVAVLFPFLVLNIDLGHEPEEDVCQRRGSSPRRRAA
jgi:hypothetical protein